MQELIEKMGWDINTLFCQEFLEKEKEQIRKSYNAGAKWGSDVTSQDYYNETFEQ